MIKTFLIILACLTPLFGAVQTEPELTPVRNLDFEEEIFPGLDEHIDRTTSNSAYFTVNGEPGREIQLTFYLPQVMTNDTFEMPVSFSSIDAGYNTVDFAASSIAFDPHTELVTPLSEEGKLHIWLGGTVHPSVNQPAGTYRTDITLDVSYTGN